jgi:hypothetical protein
MTEPWAKDWTDPDRAIAAICERVALAVLSAVSRGESSFIRISPVVPKSS